ncbi:uncharacterized protein LOC129730980 [Wyeomyia smithii]|uniref:uncharacterized protein LOC129730980 n=1 Tax=Wyeomyia smithii TaxID=174621 RepID=UPI002467D72D|nr:uncharacterized protein LOC129730980 [Wyeomyia smithii]
MSVDNQYEKSKYEMNTYLNWNQRLDDSGNCSSDNLANLSYVYEVESNDLTDIGASDVTPVNELQDGYLEEIERSDRKAKYNIIQGKLNLNEKRGPKFLCQECCYSMHTRLSMITHMKMHLKPFCEVCFVMFETQDAVIGHINAFHPEVVVRDGTPTPKDYYYMQTIAPPNTPNPISDDEMRTIEGLVNPIVKNPVNALTVTKILSQQENVDATISTDDEHGLVIDEQTRRPRAMPRKRSTPGLKRQIKKKSSVKGKPVDGSKQENVMKKITSRFGRAISLKIPQY